MVPKSYALSSSAASHGPNAQQTIALSVALVFGWTEDLPALQVKLSMRSDAEFSPSPNQIERVLTQVSIRPGSGKRLRRQKTFPSPIDFTTRIVCSGSALDSRLESPPPGMLSMGFRLRRGGVGCFHQLDIVVQSRLCTNLSLQDRIYDLDEIPMLQQDLQL